MSRRCSCGYNMVSPYPERCPKCEKITEAGKKVNRQRQRKAVRRQREAERRRKNELLTKNEFFLGEKTSLLRRYEKETGKNAIWREEITVQFKIWKRKEFSREKKENRQKERKVREVQEIPFVKKEIKMEKINTIKRTVLDLGTKFGRLQIIEISEVCSIKDENLIVDTVKEMIENKEIYGQYFSSSKSVAFNQQANIDEIDNLMKAYREWEDKKVEKK